MTTAESSQAMEETHSRESAVARDEADRTRMASNMAVTVGPSGGGIWWRCP